MRIFIPTLVIGLLSVLGPAEAAKRSVKIPDHFDGSWNIDAVTNAGPCSPSTHYAVRIRNSNVSYSGEDIGIDGGVSAKGGVTATITKGTNKVPISGRLDPKGTGSGTWQTMGALVECTGSWSAKRSS
ncbi:heme utilization protein [Methylobacterium sp. J-070]|uniref:heme utilization protein n=1 Tax=Methylobacterium sp. J-070 TaxID=2836650 RepID=UPI001FBA8E36|nr:heme utilization protein [Methylobacterium sp. J-070]MCJ2049377.1 heme utilization protein [Methylobacterium sp. J-070]